MRSTSEHLIISCDYGYNWGRADRKLRERMQLLPPGNDEQSIKCHRQRMTLLASYHLIVCQICARTNDLSTLEWMCWIYTGNPSLVTHTLIDYIMSYLNQAYRSAWLLVTQRRGYEIKSSNRSFVRLFDIFFNHWLSQIVCCSTILVFSLTN